MKIDLPVELEAPDARIRDCMLAIGFNERPYSITDDDIDPQTIGYYGPPENGPWHHNRSRHFWTEQEAKNAWEEHCRVEYAKDANYIMSDTPHFALCFWQEDWGPILIADFTDIEVVFSLVDHICATGVFFELRGGARHPGRDPMWHATFERYHDEEVLPDVFTGISGDKADAICRAAIKLLDATEKPAQE